MRERCDVGAGLAPAHGFTPSRPLRSPGSHAANRAFKFAPLVASPVPTDIYPTSPLLPFHEREEFLSRIVIPDRHILIDFFADQLY